MAATPVHLLDQTVTTRRPTNTLGASRGPIETFGDNLTSILARVQPMSGSEAVRYGRESSRRMWRVFVEPGQDIRVDDHVQYVDATTGSNVTRTLDIQEIRNPQQADVIMTLICEETQ